jgi:AcrR family transcriptional regulator
MSRMENRSQVRVELAALKRRSILSVASGLFAKFGYANTRLDTVAEHLGVTKQFIYSEFDSKAELLAEICMSAVTSSLAATEEEPDGRKSAADRMRDLVRLFVTAVCEYRTDVAVYAKERNNLREADALRLDTARRKLDERVRRIIEDGVKSGEFQVGKPRIAALTIQGMISWMYVWYHPEGPLTVDELAEEIAGQVMALLGARKTDAGTKRSKAAAKDKSA